MQPTVRNISYYRGDDFSVYVFPKDSTGAAIPMSGSTAYFRVADKRGDNPNWSANASATIAPLVSGGPNGIICTMTSGIGNNLKNGYVYDIGFVTDGKYTTVLTGNFQVMDKVVA